MKLTVGRIVHAHTPNGFSGDPGQPYAAIVTLVGESAALLRVLDPAGKNFDMTVKVSLEPDALRGPGSDCWLWRWPPRES